MLIFLVHKSIVDQQLSIRSGPIEYEDLKQFRIKHKQMFYIMTLGSSETFRGQGLGTKLMRECMNIVEQVQDCGIIYLHVITYNQTAIRFYERLGFYRIEEIPNYYSIDDKNYNCYLYAKYINGMEFNCHDSVSFLI